MYYKDFHEIVNVEHQNDYDGKSNEVLRISSHVDPTSHNFIGLMTICKNNKVLH